MYSVIVTLIPAGVFGVYWFGINTLWIMLVSIASAVLAEMLCQCIMKRPIEILDGSAVLTGLLLAYNLPPGIPLWLPAAGSFVGIVIGKQIFGGLGYNPLNPALVGRAFLMASWPVHMTVFGALPSGTSLSGIDALTSATPLNVFKQAREILLDSASHSIQEVTEASLSISQLYSSYGALFTGRIGGCIGETSAILLLFGAAFLLYKRIIGWKIPFSYIGTVALLTWIFGGTDGLLSGNPLFHVLSGGLLLGAFYMATDMVTSPVTVKGRILFGIGCGVLTVLIRLKGGYPEGVSYAILLMNLTVPLLDRYTRPKLFGGS